MKEVIPNFFKDFKCIADKCRDNCCIGWEIDIDQGTLDFYSALKSPLGDKLSVCISQEGTPHFILGENDRCPFLNKNNLCDIIIELGEDKIPYICRNHPRFYTYLPDRREAGMGLCCEAAAELVFSQKEPLDISVPYPKTDSLADVMCYARDTAFYILQNRDMPLFKRLSLLLDYLFELDEHLFFEDVKMLIKTAGNYKTKNPLPCEKSGNLLEIIRLLAELEPIDDGWKQLSSELLKNYEKITEHLPDFIRENQENLYKYEHISVYLTYRHFLGCIEDYSLVSIGNFIVLGTVYCVIIDAYNSLLNNPVATSETAHLYSKQVEYSQENTDRVMDTEITNLKELLPIIFGE